MDSDDYLLSGVMNGNPLGFDIPDGISNDMAIAMLDTCDDIIDSYRQKNRAFDVACDDRLSAWTYHPYAFEDLKVGMVVSWHGQDRHNHRYERGAIIEFGKPYDTTVWNDEGEPVQVEVRRITLERQQKRHGFDLMYHNPSITNIDWENGNGLVTVPLPVDGATLGKYRTPYL